MRDLNIESESPDDDDDIIDLEDIIEMPDKPIDEDEDLDLDVEIFDVDSHLEPKAEKAAQQAAQPMKEQPQMPGFGKEDLLKSFGDEPEEDDTLFEIAESRGVGKTHEVRAERQVFDDEAGSVLEELMDKPATPGTGDRVVAATKAAKKARSAQLEPGAAISDESLASAPSKAAAPMSAPIPPPADLSQTAEELVGRIESRLQEHIRVMVESRLPDLVRSIINEEVEKLKKEIP